jgi:hypothetical protein
VKIKHAIGWAVLGIIAGAVATIVYFAAQVAAVMQRAG